MLDDIILNYKARKVQKTYQYPLNYLFVGYYRKTDTQDELTYTYCHHECFISNAPKHHKNNISQLKRITGIYTYDEPLSFTVAPDHQQNKALDTHNNIQYTIISTLPTEFAQNCHLTHTLPNEYVSKTNIIKSIEKINRRNQTVAKRLAMYQTPIQTILDQAFDKK